MVVVKEIVVYLVVVVGGGGFGDGVGYIFLCLVFFLYVVSLF